MATIKDVSKETGLSVGTVSRILNNRGYISEASRKKVNDAMTKLNYQPNELARSLSKKSSSVIGVIVPQLQNPYFAELTGCLIDSALGFKHQILMFTSDGKEEKEAEIIEECRKNRVAGIILCSGCYAVSKFSDLGCPLVTIERSLETGTSAIECDNFMGGKLAAEHLISKGCKNLLHLSGVEGNIMPADKRALGFIEACEQHEVEHTEVPFSEELYQKMEYVDFLEEIFAMNQEIDGVFASSDVIASQVLQLCKRQKKSVPEDLKIVGFDDIPLAKWTTPTLTTIHQPVKEMAQIAIHTLLDARDGKVVPKNINMAVTLIERETT